ncbi:MAG: IS3 family transposase (plasmid) [Candidatus Manganitrophus sp.]|nr:IS3 family transposase [Candidatus Manganitrophus sp.]MDC4228139.1 IS3 family transposase [Candidatus Manganitrophus sp.]WDT73612.1 MAG: IS3 family transposase [Candidatus Manganitrophus sp.]WDT82909.1 MAG: IS3 family transposase [Candidatus Manganitrophus sp.]
MRYAFIHAHRSTHPVERLCGAVGVSRSGSYAWRSRPESRRARQNRTLLLEIRRVHAENREAYGAVKTWRALRAEGIMCGRHRVRRLRRADGIEARRMQRFRAAYQARNSAPCAPNWLNRQFDAPAPNRVWAGDITFIATRRGWLYLAVLLDLYSRRVVGWAMSERPDGQLVLDALNMAVTHRGPLPGLLHHSDQGIQYASGAYQRQLQVHGMRPSMSRKGDCYDNAVVESFFSTLKNEWVFHQSFLDRDQARAALFDYIELFYNRQRRHASLNYQSPLMYEEQSVY